MRTVFVSLLLLLTLLVVCPSSALAQDADADGLSDAVEIGSGRTDPNDADTDNDGLLDGAEDLDHDGVRDVTETNAADADTDDDGLADGEEQGVLHPLDADFDDDLLNDGQEAGRTMGIPGGTSGGGATSVPYLGTAVGWTPDGNPATRTDPGDADTDNDGIGDGLEDRDRDGTLDVVEPNPADADSDDDGRADGAEDLDRDGSLDATETHPRDFDTDDDGLGDGLETGVTGGVPGGTSQGPTAFRVAYFGTAASFTGDADPATTTNPRLVDSDVDGLADGAEDWDHDGMRGLAETDAADSDTDDDTLSDGLESLTLGTDATAADSDADGLADPVELYLGGVVDTDEDGLVDPWDPDSDGDFVPDGDDGAWDTDSDGVPDFRDADDDGDGLPTAAEGAGDPDLDGLPNYRDTDSDGDGWSDSDEQAAGTDPYDPASTPATLHAPALSSVTDVRNDQGRLVRVAWLPSNDDVPGSAQPILSYSIYRRIDAAKAVDGVDAGDVVCATAPGAWDFVLNVPATGETIYRTLAGTLCDSTSAGLCWSVFFVRAHTATPTSFFDSPPDSGWSVDNLAPGAPVGLVVAYGATNQLVWQPATDADFRYFKVYRADTPDFTPAPAYLVQTTSTTTWVDAGGDVDAHYLLTAVDFAGNEGPPAAPSATSGAGDVPVVSTVLGQNMPNPFNPRTVIAFTLARPEPVELAVHDVAGRLVRVLVAGQVLAAGAHERAWEGLDQAGRPTPAGVYYYSLRTPTHRQTRSMVLVR